MDYTKQLNTMLNEVKVHLDIDIHNINIKRKLDMILERSESNKGLFTVLITSLAYKSFHHTQDIRYHQNHMENGYSGRSFDTNYITPFLRKNEFPCMSESGWLTRSLEQPFPYTLNYQGKITPKEIKQSFLDVLHEVEINKVDAKLLLKYIFAQLIIQRTDRNINLITPMAIGSLEITIAEIIKVLKQHFSHKYSNISGSSRLPVLAIYAVYQCLIKELNRFDSCVAVEIKHHTSSDLRSGAIGDIEIIDTNGNLFEAVEIKWNRPITKDVVDIAYKKFRTKKIQRYYILSNAEFDHSDSGLIEKTQIIRESHGCQVIINGVINTLKYYLRLLSNTSQFIDIYISLVKSDQTIKYEHKLQWNEILRNIATKKV